MARTKTLKKPGEIALVVAYVLQKLGEGSAEAVYDAIHTKKTHLAALGVTISKANIRGQLEALRARGILSIRFGEEEGKATKQNLYKMRRAAWAAPPEVARFTQLQPTLLKTLDDEKLKEFFDTDENAEKPEATKGAGKSRNHYRAFRTFLLRLRTLQPWYGGQPLNGNPALERLYEASPHKAHEGEPQLVFERLEDGRLFIHAGVVRGWVASLAFGEGYSLEGVKERVGSNGITIVPNSIEVEQRPINGGGGPGAGKGMARYEVLPAGQEVTVMVRVPTEGPKAPTVKAWATMFSWGVAFAPRHLSPARGRMSGACELLQIDEVAEPKAPKIGKTTALAALGGEEVA